MIFQCADLDRALEHPELMPDARAHAARCPKCSEQLYLWAEISRAGAQLHREWESPELWPRIQAELAAAAPRRKVGPDVAVGDGRGGRRAPGGRRSFGPWRQQSRDFLTEEALDQVQRAEAAYAQSIEKLSKVAAPGAGAVACAAGGRLSGEAAAPRLRNRRDQSRGRKQSLQRLRADAVGFALSREAEDLTGMAGLCEAQFHSY